MAFLRIELVTHIERTLAIALVKDIILNAEGWVISHQFLSNTLASLNFEIPYATIDRFLSSLISEDFTFSLIENCPREKEGDVCGDVSLTFVHNAPI